MRIYKNRNALRRQKQQKFDDDDEKRKEKAEVLEEQFYAGYALNGGRITQPVP
jgi:hypothetical protein